MLDLTVVIVTWNSAAVIGDCLGSLAAAGAGAAFRVVVVDNASADDTPRRVREALPSARLVENAGNAGFAAANNRAFALADSRYLLLLNPDTVVRPGALGALVAFLEARPAVWAAGPAILNADGSPQRAGVSFPSLWNLLCETFFLDRAFPRSRLFGAHRRLFEDDSRPREVDYLQGSALMVRREVLDRVGGMDERFFLYFEETDWCYRMRAAGGVVMQCPDAAVVHLGGGEFGHFDERRLTAYHRSLLAFYRKHRPAAARAALRALLAARALVRLAAWAAWALSRPDRRAKALACARGYVKVLPLLLGKGGAPA